MSSNEVKVSIIVPVFNSEKHLASALGSVLGQTLKEIEVICVNDGSSDHSAEILANAAAQDSRLKVVTHPSNRGTLAARNTGIANVRGKYILFLDPDDTLQPETAEEVLLVAESKDADIVCFGANEYILKQDGSREQVSNLPDPAAMEIRGPGLVLKNLLVERGHLWCLCMKMIRADLCKKAAEIAGNQYCVMAEDFLLYTGIAYYAQSLISLDKKYYNYYISEGITAESKVSLSRFTGITSELNALTKIEQLLKEKHLFEQSEYRDAFASIERIQMRRLWFRWYAIETEPDKIAAIKIMLEKTPYPERLIYAIPPLSNLDPNLLKQVHPLIHDPFIPSALQIILNAALLDLDAEKLQTEKLQAENTLLKQSLSRADIEVENLKIENILLQQSFSYRAGKMITALPRFLYSQLARFKKK